VSNVVLVVVVAAVSWLMVAVVRRRRHGLVAERGTSIGADLGAMTDQPRVRVRSMTKAGPDRVRLVLTPEGTEIVGADVDLLVFLRDEEVGFELLQDWEDRQTPLAMVMLPGNELLRLRSIDDLQPLTLRCVTEGSA
jgi:hypothetical protein